MRERRNENWRRKGGSEGRTTEMKEMRKRSRKTMKRTINEKTMRENRHE